MSAEARPVVSVVIPTFDAGPTLLETIQSVLQQEGPSLELVVSDQSSMDGTRERLASIVDRRLRVVTMPRDAGAAANWTAATRAAAGEFVKLLCQDDLLEPGCLQAQVAALRAHPEAGFVASRRAVIDATGRVLLRARPGLGTAGSLPGREAARQSLRSGTNAFGEPACVLFRREPLLKAMPWCDSEPYVIDLELYVRVLHGADVVVDPQVRARFRAGGESWSGRLRSEQFRAFRWLLLREREALGLGRVDVLLGLSRAWLAQWARMAVYLVLHLRTGSAGRRPN